MLEKDANRDEIAAHLAAPRLFATEAAIIAPSHAVCPNIGCKPLGRRLAPTPRWKWNNKGYQLLIYTIHWVIGFDRCFHVISKS
jgi:hypothetical protein